MSFKEKAFTLLKYLYDNGGKDYQPLDMVTNDDKYVMACQADDKRELTSIMDYLIQTKFWVKGKPNKTIDGGAYWFDVSLTEAGINEVEKGMPSVPMIGLVSQEIATGDRLTDEKINHAKKLFFDEPSTMDNKRSACETLCFVLEPLRDSLKPTFTDADVNTFFELVNKFDIRHNKDITMKLVHEEQLEWVFYTLLNTINTYTKLKARLAV